MDLKHKIGTQHTHATFRLNLSYMDLKVISICCVPCKYSNVYVRKGGITTESRCKEHTAYMYLGQPEKSVVTEHKLAAGHNKTSSAPPY
jgi:hypothetical protein